MSKVNKGAALYTCNVSWTKIKFRKVENGIGVRQLDERQRAQPDMQWGLRGLGEVGIWVSGPLPASLTDEMGCQCFDTAAHRHGDNRHSSAISFLALWLN